MPARPRLPGPRPVPLKICHQADCMTPQPTGRSNCIVCGAPFYNRRRMSSSAAVKILLVAAITHMRAVERTSEGGQALYAAWAHCFKLVYHHDPQPSDFTAAGL